MCDPKQQSKIEFVSFCIEQYKKANKQNGAEAEQLFFDMRREIDPVAADVISCGRFVI